MIWFFEKKKEGEISPAHAPISNAFAHIRNDITHVFNWLKYFHEKHQVHDDRLARLEQQMSSLDNLHAKHHAQDEKLARMEEKMVVSVRSPEQIKLVVDSYYSYDSLHEKVRQLHARLDTLETMKHPFQHMQPRTERTSGLKERLLRKISRNSKDYVKSVILSMVKKYDHVPGSQLKEMIVDEQGLCSKSSFYRLLGELEAAREVAASPTGKEKMYSAKKPDFKLDIQR